MASMQATATGQQPFLRQTANGQPVQTLPLGEWMRAHNKKLRELVLINHGVAEVDHRILTLDEAPISSTGRAQMLAAAQRLDRESFFPQAIVIANDQRCLESAEMLQKFFTETHFPTSERLKQKTLPASAKGKTVEQIRAENVLLHRHIVTPHLEPHVTLEGGESYQQFFDRVVAAFKKIAENYGVAAAVTHNSNILAIAGFILGLNTRVLGEWEGPLYGAITHIVFEGTEAIFKKFVEITHLPQNARE